MKKELRVISARHHAEPFRRGERSFLSRYLDPIDIAAELLTGTILALSFTLGGSLIVGEGPDATRKMLLGVLGCNVAWGIIDGTTCLMSRMYELRRKARLHAAVRASVAGEEAAAIVADELNEELAGFASPTELTQFYRHVAAHLSHFVPGPVRLAKEDFYRALITFGLMCATTLPAVRPFLLLGDRDARAPPVQFAALDGALPYRLPVGTHHAQPSLDLRLGRAADRAGLGRGRHVVRTLMRNARRLSASSSLLLGALVIAGRCARVDGRSAGSPEERNTDDRAARDCAVKTGPSTRRVSST